MDNGQKMVPSTPFSGLLAHFTVYTAMGSLLLYLIGYLVLRFRLAALGIRLDIPLLEGQYPMTGAMFLFQCLTRLRPWRLLSLFVFFLLSYVLRVLISRWNSAGIVRTKRSRAQLLSALLWRRMGSWWSDPFVVALIGMALGATLAVWMAPCLYFDNLLLQTLPPNEWHVGAPLQDILFDESDDALWGNILWILAGIVVTTCLFMRANRLVLTAMPFPRLFVKFLGFVLVIDVLLLPVFYGILGAGRQVIQSDFLEVPGDLKAGQRAWLIWPGNEWFTYLVCDRTHCQESRVLVSVPKRQIKRIEIKKYEKNLLRSIFPNRGRPRSGIVSAASTLQGHYALGVSP